jgi:hypothetical protein
MSEFIEAKEGAEDIAIYTPPETKKEEMDFDEDFDKFISSTSSHDIPEEEDTPGEFIPDKDNRDAGEEFKLRIFIGLFFMLIDGFHAFAFSMFSKHKITSEEIGLDADDQEGLEIYFKGSQKIMNFINKLSPEIMGLIHMEWLYFNKFKEIVKRKELEEANTEEEEEDEMEEIEKPKPKPRKKRRKKKPVKKSAEKKPTAKAEEKK